MPSVYLYFGCHVQLLRDLMNVLLRYWPSGYRIDWRVTSLPLFSFRIVVGVRSDTFTPKRASSCTPKESSSLFFRALFEAVMRSEAIQQVQSWMCLFWKFVAFEFSACPKRTGYFPIYLVAFYADQCSDATVISRMTVSNFIPSAWCSGRFMPSYSLVISCALWFIIFFSLNMGLFSNSGGMVSLLSVSVLVYAL